MSSTTPVCVALLLGSTVCALAGFFDIVPEVVREQPQSVLGVFYPSCGGPVSLVPGLELTPTMVRERPQVLWPARQGTCYALLMLDPDVPNRQNQSGGQFLHWLVGNIPGSDVLRGETLAEYIGSGPGIGSGPHRYVFLLFEQPAMTPFQGQLRLNASSAAGRALFSAQDFADRYMLRQPAVAATYYVAQWDPYAAIVRGQLGIFD